MKKDVCPPVLSLLKTALVVMVFSLDPVHAAESQSKSGDDALAKRYEAVSKKLEDFKSLPDNPNDARKNVLLLVTLSKTAPEKLKVIVLDAACAGFIVVGDRSSYLKLKNRLESVQAFDLAVMDLCPKCPVGAPNRQCRKCNGSGLVINTDSAKKFYQQRILDAIAECKKHIPAPKPKTPPQQQGSQVHQSAQPPQQAKVDMSELRKRLEPLSSTRYSFLADDIVYACDALLSVHPNDEIRELVGKCSYRLDPLRKAKQTKNETDWKREIETLRATALNVKNARKEAELDNEKTAVNYEKNVKFLFDYERYVKEYCDPNGTALKRTKLLDSFWNDNFQSEQWKDYVKVSFVAVPNKMKFVVKDVSIGQNEHGKQAYRVSVSPLVYGKHDYLLGSEWRGDPKQTELFVSMVKNTGGLGGELLIGVKASNDPESWSKGTILEADHWIATWGVEMSVSIFTDGSKRENRKIHDPEEMGFMFRSLDELLEMEFDQ